MKGMGRGGRERERERERVTTSVWIQTRNLSIRIECLHHWAISPPSKRERCMAAWSLRHQDTNLGGREEERERVLLYVSGYNPNKSREKVGRPDVSRFGLAVRR